MTMNVDFSFSTDKEDFTAWISVHHSLGKSYSRENMAACAASGNDKPDMMIIPFFHLNALKPLLHIL